MNSTQTLLISSAPLLAQGLMMTIKIWIVASLISCLIGMILGIARSQQVRSAGVANFLDALTFVLRGVPLYVQLLISYFVLPDLIGINLPVFAAATITLGCCSAAYVSQIVRSGINSIAPGQWEAGFVLGYTRLQIIWWIIIPQMMRNVFPALIAECDQLLKSTSIVSSLGVLELTRVGMNIVAREMSPLTIYLTIAVLYLLISSILNGVAALLERKVCS